MSKITDTLERSVGLLGAAASMLRAIDYPDVAAVHEADAAQLRELAVRARRHIEHPWNATYTSELLSFIRGTNA